eukprot:856251-Pleurochrysis_carterae.AAC.2
MPVGLRALSHLCSCASLRLCVSSSRSELFSRIKRGSYSFPEPLGQTSPLARDLISRLLRLAPMERYSTREAIQHPWIAGARDDLRAS